MGSVAPPSAQQTNGTHAPRRVYLLTCPRTASNLFVKILNLPEQPNVTAGPFNAGYWFFPAFMKRSALQKWDVPLDSLPTDDIDTIADDLQAGATGLHEFLESSAQAGKTAFVKEHVYIMTRPAVLNELAHGVPAESVEHPITVHMDRDTDVHTASNPTVLPDNWLYTFQPTILIRHPALQIPSLYRSMTEAMGPPDTASKRAGVAAPYDLTPVRRLYDLYALHHQQHSRAGASADADDGPSPWPFVIDSSEFITDPALYMERFCRLNGLDFTACRFQWAVASKDELAQMGSDANRRFLSTLSASTGVDARKAQADVSVEGEVPKWRAEFGDEVAADLERWATRCMPDYEYLMAKRWRPAADGSVVKNGSV